MYCPSCGASNVEYGVACMSCGRPLPLHAAGNRARFGADVRAPEDPATDVRHRPAWPVAPWVVAAAGLTAIMLIGLSTRVAVPAYRAYAIGAQITEGLDLAEPHKAAVVAVWESAGRNFGGIRSRSVGPELAKHGKYVEAVDIASGAIVITYGASADPALQKRTLTIVPALDATAQFVEWQCGRGPAPDGFEAIFDAPSRLTDVPDEYLPPGCRGR